MKWKLPPKIKIYEAYSAIGDKRVQINATGAQITSSGNRKICVVNFDQEKNAIYSNDNGSYWQGYLGYPSIAYLMLIGKIIFNKEYAIALSKIDWKDINLKFKNDYGKGVEFADSIISIKHSVPEFHKEINNILEQIKLLDMEVLEPRIKPPI